jgi:hypothetical protein
MAIEVSLTVTGVADGISLGRIGISLVRVRCIRAVVTGIPKMIAIGIFLAHAAESIDPALLITRAGLLNSALRTGA